MALRRSWGEGGAGGYEITSSSVAALCCPGGKSQFWGVLYLFFFTAVNGRSHSAITLASIQASLLLPLVLPIPPLPLLCGTSAPLFFFRDLLWFYLMGCFIQQNVFMIYDDFERPTNQVMVQRNLFWDPNCLRTNIVDLSSELKRFRWKVKPEPESLGAVPVDLSSGTDPRDVGAGPWTEPRPTSPVLDTWSRLSDSEGQILTRLWINCLWIDLRTGSGQNRRISGFGFSGDLLWQKKPDEVENSNLWNLQMNLDSTRFYLYYLSFIIYNINYVYFNYIHY